MNKEQWTVIGVGVALGMLLFHLAGGLRGEVAGLRGEVADLRAQVGSVEARLSHIEGWIQGRFREGTTSE